MCFGEIPQDTLKSYSGRVTKYPRFRLKVTKGRGFLQIPSVCPNGYKYPNGYWFVTIWLMLQKPSKALFFRSFSDRHSRSTDAPLGGYKEIPQGCLENTPGLSQKYPPVIPKVTEKILKLASHKRFRFWLHV